MRESVDSLVFVGSAGAYSKDIEIGDVYISDTVSHIESSFLYDKAYTPLDNCIQSNILTNKYLVSYETLHIESCKKATVNSSNYITTDEETAMRFTHAGISLENMEFFSIMRVAQYFNIPCVGVFAVSNYCHQNAHAEFMRNHSKIKQILLGHVLFIQTLDSVLSRRNESIHQ